MTRRILEDDLVLLWLNPCICKRVGRGLFLFLSRPTQTSRGLMKILDYTDFHLCGWREKLRYFMPVILSAAPRAIAMRILRPDTRRPRSLFHIALCSLTDSITMYRSHIMSASVLGL